MPFARRSEKRNYRVVVLGSSRVGKTSVISQFLFNTFSEHYKETLEELHRHTLTYENKAIDIDILDTCGSHEFPAMRKLAITTGNAFLLVYSVDDPESFESVKQLIAEVKECKQDSDYLVLVIANKTDLGPNQSCDQAVKETTVCLEWEEMFFKTSAKTGENIANVFQTLEEKIKEHLILEYSKQPNQRRISLPTMKIVKHKNETPRTPKKPKLKTKAFSVDS